MLENFFRKPAGESVDTEPEEEIISSSRRMATLVVQAFGAGVTDADGKRSEARTELRKMGYDISGFEHVATKPPLGEIIRILNMQQEAKDKKETDNEE